MVTPQSGFSARSYIPRTNPTPQSDDLVGSWGERVEIYL